ncbi:hypothetical protein D7V97_10795 [Corallococcus sp. CA053C]|uniref:hypothetical protein n=1 Tax=Corallococcus sp. CA053C TaxID=2316732 RepID=UPI000EA25A1A|nr:hypothetical protein [Corallococcus sp. CA053C]RKH11585.1 hypothetical protein D7V97_10795 [Corallococcus sp. CA053C]
MSRKVFVVVAGLALVLALALVLGWLRAAPTATVPDAAAQASTPGGSPTAGGAPAPRRSASATTAPVEQAMRDAEGALRVFLQTGASVPDEARRRELGAPGSPAVLTLHRSGQPLSLTFTRAR